MSSTTTTYTAATSTPDTARLQQVRRPLQVAVGLVELLGKTTLDLEQQRYLSLLRDALDAMATGLGPAVVTRPLESARVLVIGDVACSGMSMREVLAGAGARVLSCVDVDDVLTRLAQHPASLVVLDLEMTQPSGFDVLRRLRAQAAPLHGAPVLVVSAADEREVAAEVASLSASLLSKSGGLHAIVSSAIRALRSGPDGAPDHEASDVDVALETEAAFAQAVANNDRRRLAMLIGALRLHDARLAAALDDALGRGDLEALLRRLRRRRRPVTASFSVAATLQRTFVAGLVVEETRLRQAGLADGAAVRAIAHRIAGSAATFGAPALGLVARDICRALSVSPDVDVAALACRLADEMAALREGAEQADTDAGRSPDACEP